MAAPREYVIDPDDPRAPPQELWDTLTAEQRQQIIDELPSEFEASEACPPEGDVHYDAVKSAREMLRGFFQLVSPGSPSALG